MYVVCVAGWRCESRRCGSGCESRIHCDLISFKEPENQRTRTGKLTVVEVGGLECAEVGRNGRNWVS